MDEIITVQHRKEKKKKLPFVAGVLILALAVVGVISIVNVCVEHFGKSDDLTAEYKRYSQFLTWVVGVDPEPFSDITKANKEALRNIAVCSLMSDDVKTGQYEVTSQGLKVPAEDVANYYQSMFGAETQIVHGTVVGYGYQFNYDDAENVYYVPLSGTTPPFIVRIESVKKSGGVIELRVGYVGASNVEVQPDGTVVAADPDKYSDITIKETENGGFNLISITSVTMGEHQ